MRNTILAALFLFFTLGCKEKQDKIEEPDVESLRAQVKPTEVATARAILSTFEFRINASGTMESSNELKVTFQGSGYLEKLNIRNGQMVQAGQLLAELENTSEEFALEKAQLAYEKAQVAFQNDSLGYSKLTDNARNNLELSSGLRDARVNLREARINLEKTKVKAPINGRVAELEEKQGNIISSGNDLCVIYAPNQLVLTAKILESDYGRIKLGLKADIYPLAFKDMVFQATLVEINPKVDENGMVSVKLQLDETEGLLPGMNANAVIRSPQSENVLVPRQAVVMKSGRPVVFTYENGVAKWNYVETGLDNGVDIEITSGISDQSEVIITNNIQLAHDAQVTRATELGNSNQ
ncbi:efflux RND transporter periplasmic adaptor subunit [Roseivirga sp.]|uniref:efflux RND transporter periplasmic adaptor subunit n=1 Tax=Roseivirga sp. TaxID=1964215 RepID=UPI003B522690